MRRFDLRQELKETAERRKRYGTADAKVAAAQHGRLPVAPTSSALMQQKVDPGVAARLAVMFPGVPQETVEDVLSALSRMDSSCSREQLADRAVEALLQMASTEGADTPQAVTSFEPKTFGDVVDVEVEDAIPSAPPLHEGDAFNNAGGIHFDETLDALLAEVLSLPDDSLRPCLSTLLTILRNIVDSPGEDRKRRLKKENDSFRKKVGCHSFAINLLLLAGFEEICLDGEEVIYFMGKPTAPGFVNVYDALKAMAEDCGVMDSAAHAAPSSTQPPPAQCRPSASLHAGARNERRSRIAELTEQRLQNPVAFRQAALQRSAGNRVIAQRLTASQPVASTDRRARHFTLADIEQMRIRDDISNMPNYAEQYRREQRPVHDYTSLVAQSYDPALISRQALDGTNRYRASKNVSPLRWHEGIAQIAQQHAQQMASGAMPFSHDGFDARVRAFPVAHRSAAENLALNKGVAQVAEAAVDGWIKSPGHEKNLRGPYNLCGIGTARSADGTFYLTQLFANAL